MVLVYGQGLPLGVRLESASPHEVTLAEATLQAATPKWSARVDCIFRGQFLA
jgi:hypothetical protein